MLDPGPGRQPHIGTALATGLLARDDVQRAINRLASEFAGPDHLGPQSFVRFMTPEDARQDDRIRLARQAAGAVTAFLEHLNPD